MSLMSWLKPTKRSIPSAPPQIEQEKKALQAELAQTVVTFERRRHTVQQIAEEAMRTMHHEKGGGN